MKHLVIIPDGVTSKRLSAVEMARRLRDAGYQITFIGKGGDYTQIDGFDYLRLDLELNHFSREFQRAANEPSMLKNGSDMGQINAEDPLVPVNPLQRILEKIRPDLILIDLEMHPYVLAAIASKFSVAIFSVFFNIRKYRSMPPLNYDIVPGVGVTGHPIMIEMVWLRYRLSRLFSNYRDKFRGAGKDRVSQFANLAQILGLRLSDHVDFYQWLIPFSYRRLPVLVLNPVEMEFPFRPHHTTSYVGPMTCGDRQNIPFLPGSREKSKGIDGLFDPKSWKRRERRLLYCSFGSFIKVDDRNLWQKLITAFGNTSWDVILALGNRLDPDHFNEVPENIRCFAFAPQMEILAVADCAIIHGGMHSVYECIQFEVPMIVYPFDKIDQMGTAARVVYHHIGFRGDRENDSPAEIRNRVERAMNDKELKENIRCMKKQIETYKETNVIADAVRRIIEAAS